VSFLEKEMAKKSSKSDTLLRNFATTINFGNLIRRAYRFHLVSFKSAQI